MRVFVLGTGRCGTTTFIAACGAFDNYSAGHETLVAQVGAARFDYPDGHIEADNRLGWMLGGLGRRFDDSDALYVHLRRGVDDVVASFLARWDSQYRAGIIRSFAHGIVMRGKDWDEDQREQVCRFYVDTMTDNIEQFLVRRPSLELWLEDLPATFGTFVERIGAEGDMALAHNELSVQHNAR